MPGQERRQVRQPATKQGHLQKKFRQQQTGRVDKPTHNKPRWPQGQ